ncbi:MAG TPA: hypothetical protein DCZ10_15945 [Pelotomaculum sp.]|nr:hypothetical protein [Pelotomaculum sp.]
MSKALQLTDSLKAAEAAVKNLVHPASIQWENGKWQVILSFYRDLEQIPGRPEFIEISNGFHAAKAIKELQGVTFFCYLVESEYRELKEKKKKKIA